MKQKKILMIINLILAAIILFTIIMAVISLCASSSNLFLTYMRSFPALLFFAVLPCILLILSLAIFIPRSKTETIIVQESAERKTKVAIPKSEYTLEDLFKEVEKTQAMKNASPRTVARLASKLEKFKNKKDHSENEEAQQKLKQALNWCYEQLGDVKYDL